MNKNSTKNSWKRMSNFIWLTPSRRCKRRSCWTISCRPCQLLLAGTYKVRKIPKKECRFKEVFQILNANFFENFSNGMALHWEWRKKRDHFLHYFFSIFRTKWAISADSVQKDCLQYKYFHHSQRFTYQNFLNFLFHFLNTFLEF